MLRACEPEANSLEQFSHIQSDIIRNTVPDHVQLLRAGPALALAGLVVLVAVGCGPTAAVPAADHVVVISIDGLPGEYIGDSGTDRLELPTISGLRDTGSYAEAVVGQYPSDTYPSHASIVTGVPPALHGIVANRILRPDGDQSQWFREASHFRSSPIWRTAAEYGLTTAAVMWPVTVGADIDYLIPETGAPPPDRPWPNHLPTVSTSGLSEHVFAEMGIGTETPITPELVDRFSTKAATHIITTYKPALLLVHLFQTDSAQHRTGRHSPESLNAFRAVDRHIESIVAAVDDAGIGERTAFIVTGDHGFADVERAVRPNVLLRRAGLIETNEHGDIVSWSAIAAAGAIVTLEPGDSETAAAARSALSAGTEALLRIVERNELDTLGANPQAAFFVEPAAGYSLDVGWTGDAVVTPAIGRGAHGFLPDRPDMATGLILSGSGIRAGATLGTVQLVDLAPTVSQLLGFRMEGARGAVLVGALKASVP